MSASVLSLSRRLPTEYCHLVRYDTVAEYREHFEREYCREPISTFDSIAVIFRPDDFGHAFFKGEYRQWFCWPRAERIDWICKALQDPSAWLCPGYDKRTEKHEWNRRVCFVNGDYAVIIEFVASDEARLVTAYLANGRTPRLFMESPPWR